MLHIDIPKKDQKKLEKAATEAGYSDVAAFAAHHLQTIARTSPNAFYDQLDENDLRASAAECDAAMKRIQNGKGKSFEKSMKAIADDLGIPLH